MNTNIASVHAVADYFLLKIRPESGDSITNLKLQKLVYYAQVKCLFANDRPMFQEEIQAWMKGPVCPVLYRRFKKFKWQAIDTSELKSNPLKEISDADLGLLDEVWCEYAHLSGAQLVTLTHAEAPWRDAYGDRPRGSHCEEEITLQSLRSFIATKRKRKNGIKEEAL